MKFDGGQRIEVHGMRLESARRHDTDGRPLVVDQQRERQPLRPVYHLGVHPAQRVLDANNRRRVHITGHRG